MTFRDNGAIGALLDEYERSINELIEVIKVISPRVLETIVDPITKDEDCRSIQTILSHVVESGYTYSVEIQKHLKIETTYKSKEVLATSADYIESLKQMFSYCENVFKEISNDQLVEKDNQKKIIVRWGQPYDIDQLMEHAIVHILRHRRQIERFLIKLH